MSIRNWLDNLTPDTLVYIIKSNPLVVQSTLYKFASYKAFAESLTTDQQTNISGNLYKLGEFFKTTEGKQSINTFVNTFIDFACKT